MAYTWISLSTPIGNSIVLMNPSTSESLSTRYSIEEWEKDSPPTVIGYYQAHLVGSSLKSAGVNSSKAIL